ncbi:methionyl-tRNA synthetase [Mycoplasmoides fastidiosum]|uniref:Methionine--tRNA ligase n=1 Tax=Mycoplasmoides fastidiosum TaxID=92758 RepID=A0ABU0M044_9BACT|nr:methionine--tRNA ligase [Mycoplasmoides fastidiosum]MDQ0514327.1 methionyl-tRNA synthetase [Mycoplasmoides fastidiosum]UUD38070.1 methionine--tRNA ligase [Mycoplasmoides fastidiosum]
MSKKVYITTPIYYPSAQPHIGHLYTTYLADALKDYYQLIGYDAYFLTGTDEHGQKIEQAAKQAQLDPLTYISQYVEIFQDLWKKMNINYNQFIRTTDPQHQQTVQKIFQKLEDLDLIYAGTWTGWYCISCEENYTLDKAQEIDGQWYCVFGHQLIEQNEPSLFYKISQFQNWLKTYYQTHDFLFPANRKHELLNNFIDNDLEDLSVSRTKFQWGIPILSHPDHVIYVWIDALCNYISALGYLTEDDQLFQKYWNDPTTKIIHITAKEISRFHAIYWPIILKSLDLRLFDKLISHGWILMNNTKMSKSLKNVIDPFFLAQHFPHDGIRYFLLSFSLERDNNFSYHELIANYNTNIVNTYGNLISRLVGMLKKYTNGQVLHFSLEQLSSPLQTIEQNLQAFLTTFPSLVEADNPKVILERMNQLIVESSKIIEILKPWELWKNNEHTPVQQLLFVLYKLAVISCFVYQPVLKDSFQQAKTILGLAGIDLTYQWLLDHQSWINLAINHEVSAILYQRLELDYFEKLVDNE